MKRFEKENTKPSGMSRLSLGGSGGYLDDASTDVQSLLGQLKEEASLKCQNLNLRRSNYMGVYESRGDRKIGDNQRLDDLHLKSQNQVIRESTSGRSIDQLYHELVRVKGDQQANIDSLGDQTTFESRAYSQSNGRDFFVRQQFDVDDFEFELKNMHNPFKSQIKPDQTMSSSAVEYQVMERPREVTSFKKVLETEGTNQNLRARAAASEGQFYGKLIKKFRKCLTHLKVEKVDG
jgi:Tfp pilus assembly protein PilP